MGMMKIVQAPRPVLSQVAKPIAKIDKEILLLIKDMEKSLLSASDPEGVGLAAPQVGKSLQLFLVKQSPDSPLQVFINPEIKSIIKQAETKPKGKKRKNKDGVQLEGCLSLQDIWGVVRRHKEVVLSYQDEKGHKHERTFDGFLATIIQHEYDHLQGVLFPKRVLEQKNILYKSKKDKTGEMVFEEITL